MFWALAVVAAAQLTGCNSISTEHIYGKDLAAAIPALAGLPATQAFSLSPIPGQRRVFRSNELTRIAKANGLAAPVEAEACFEWERDVPEPNTVLAAMRESLAGMHATVELADTPANPIPKGSLSFPLTGLSGSSDGPVVWRGAVTYAPNHTLPVWARVRVTVHETRVVTKETLRPGIPISAADIAAENYSGPFQHEKKYGDPQQVIGLVPKNTIPAGAVLTPMLVRAANDVERGDTVQVVVEIASARIEAQGIAEDGGPKGSFVMVRNPKSGRRFRARVEDRDKVVVLPTSLAGLAVEEPKS